MVGKRVGPTGTQYSDVVQIFFSGRLCWQSDGGAVRAAMRGQCRGLDAEELEQGGEGFSCCDVDREVSHIRAPQEQIKIRMRGEPRTKTRTKAARAVAESGRQSGREQDGAQSQGVRREEERPRPVLRRASALRAPLPGCWARRRPRATWLTQSLTHMLTHTALTGHVLRPTLGPTCTVFLWSSDMEHLGPFISQVFGTQLLSPREFLIPLSTS